MVVTESMERIVLVFDPNDRKKYFCGFKCIDNDGRKMFELWYDFVDGSVIVFDLMINNKEYNITDVRDNSGVSCFEEFKNWVVKVI